MCARSRALILLSVLGMATLVWAADMEHRTERIEVQGASRLDVSLDFGAGEINLVAEDMDEAAKADIDYNPRHCDYDIEYEVKDGTGHLLMESINKRKNGIDTDDNLWDVTLSRKYPLDLELDIGACEADMDLGGLQLKHFYLDVGAASAFIDFSEPNPVRLEEIEIEAGASSLEIANLGNANFEYLDFSGGVGSFELDLQGEYTGESRARFEVGLGSMDITIPKDLPVRIETKDDNWLSSVDFHRENVEEIEEGVFESPGFEDAKVRLVLEIEVGLGSVDVYWR